MAYNDALTWEENLRLLEAKGDDWSEGPWHGSQGGKVEHYVHSSGGHQIVKHPKHGDAYHLVGPKGMKSPLASGTLDEMKAKVSPPDADPGTGDDDGGGSPPDIMPRPTPTGGRRRTAPSEVQYSTLESTMQYHNDYLSIEENEALRQQKLMEDLNCPPLPMPLREAGYRGPMSNGSGRTYKEPASAFEPPDFDEPNYYGEDEPDEDEEEIEEGDENPDDPAVKRHVKKQNAMHTNFQTGYDHGYTGSDYTGGDGTIYYGAGYREGEQHAKEGKPHYYKKDELQETDGVAGIY